VISKTPLFLVVSLACFGCSPAIHQVVDNMSSAERSEWLSAQSESILCSGHSRQWASEETKSMIEAELFSRQVFSCPNSVLGESSLALSKQSYSRSTSPVQSTENTKNDKNCSDFSSASIAQKFFLAQGGPLIDRNDLDRDGDGLACEWGTELMSRLEAQRRNLNRRPKPTRAPTISSRCHYVSGYRRKNGSYVRGHRRCR